MRSRAKSVDRAEDSDYSSGTQMSNSEPALPLCAPRPGLAPWVAFAVLTVVFWGLWALLSKMAGDTLTAAQSQVISTIGLLPILAVLGRKGVSPSSKRGMLLALGGGLIGGAGNALFYRVLALEQATTVVPLTAFYPMVTIGLALIFLKERMSRAQAGGIGLALAAIYFFNVGREGGFEARALLHILLPVFCWGVAGLLQKLCTNDLSSELSTFWFLMGSAAISAALLAAQPMNWAVSGKAWGLAVGLGFFLGLGNWTVIQAYARGGKASIITPLAGLYPLVSVPLAVLLLGEKIGARTALGLALSVPAIWLLSMERPPKSRDQTRSKLRPEGWFARGSAGRQR